MRFEVIHVSLGRQVKHALLVLGVAFLVWSLFVAVRYVFQMNYDIEWGERHLLYDLGFIVMGVAFELLGLGLIALGKKQLHSDHRLVWLWSGCGKRPKALNFIMFVLF